MVGPDEFFVSSVSLGGGVDCDYGLCHILMLAFRGTLGYLLLFHFVSLFVELSLVVCGCGVVQAAGFLVCAVYC